MSKERELINRICKLDFSPQAFLDSYNAIKRKPLSDEKISQILVDEQIPVRTGNTARKFARAIEKAHGIGEENETVS